MSRAPSPFLPRSLLFVIPAFAGMTKYGAQQVYEAQKEKAPKNLEAFSNTKNKTQIA